MSSRSPVAPIARSWSRSLEFALIVIAREFVDLIADTKNSANPFPVLPRLASVVIASRGWTSPLCFFPSSERGTCGQQLLVDFCCPRILNASPGGDTIEPMALHFETRDWVPFPVELVFAFFANPSNLPHLMPPAQQARIEDVRMVPPPPRPVAADPARRFRSVAAGVGTEIIISFRPLAWLSQRVGWTARIVEFEWNSHFADEQIKGPFKQFHHRHGIVAETRDGIEGTVVTDSIDYALSGGIFGKLAQGIVRKQMESAWSYRQKRLPEILAVAQRQAVQRA